MNINWTNIITNAASLTVILIAIFQLSRGLERAIKEAAIAKDRADNKSAAQQERISILEGLVDILSERLNEVEEHLVKPNDEHSQYFRRKAIPRLEKKALKRYQKVDTDLT